MNRRSILTGGLAALASVMTVTPASTAFYWEGLYPGCNCGSVKKRYAKKPTNNRVGKDVKGGKVWNKATTSRDSKDRSRSKQDKDMK